MKTSTKAFTLIELLIVVIVLGILAGIAVPRYARVLENRKASEAEEILSAVRTEQEARCIAGKPYLTESRRADLTTLAGAGKSQNYTYTLASKAIVAKRDVKNGYTLMMPYKSGQICCMGNGCSGLNKDYPGCPSEFGADECEADADYIEQKEADHGCVCYDKNGVERGAGYVESQSCSYGPAQTHTCLQSGNTCNWSTWSKCQTAPEPPQPPQSCSVCQDGDTQYALGAQETRACPGGGMESRTCSKNGDVCSMSGWSGCETEPEPEPETCYCDGLDGAKYPEGGTETEKCPSGSENPTHSRTCEKGCQWGEWSKCWPCSNPDPCVDGFTFEKCKCVPCPESQGLQVNASKTGCECTDALKAECAANKQKVWDNSDYARSLIMYNSAQCYCYGCSLEKEDCKQQGMVLDSSACKCISCSEVDPQYTGQSTTGDRYGCEKVKCPKTREDCAAQGLVLKDENRYDCQCVSCSDKYGKKGKSTDGTFDTCQDDKCELTAQDCVNQGGKILADSYSSSCKCITCSEYSPSYTGVSTDGTYNTCEKATCKLTKADCAQKGQVLYNEGSYSCSCVDCSYYSSAYKGKSTDGTINTCESKCKHTVEECKAKGLVLTNPGSESCACKKCSEINAAYSGDSTDGTVGGCQQASCKLTKSDCAQKGQVLLYPESYSCKCVDCSYYSSYKGKSKDGTFETCDKNTCEKTAAECGAKGLVLKNASSPNCECVSCSAINKAYTGTSSTGYESDCGGAKCELTVDKCKAQGLVLVNQYSKDCKCVSCDTNTNYKGKSKTGTYQGCDPVTCEKTAAACGAKGLVLKYPASVNCECVSCSDYDSRYQGTSSSGYIQDCEKKPEQKCQLTEAKCAESGKALINGYSPNCYCAGCEVCASWLAGATSKEGTCASCDWCDRP